MLRCVLAGAATLLIAAAAHAQEFYAGKTITIITSTGAGGSYDLAARTLSRHMPRYLPGQPTMIVQNMPGGGNVVATNHMFNVAAKDGTVIATINNTIPLHQVIDGRGVRYDADKFNWLGSTGACNSVTIVRRVTGIKSIEDVKKREVMLGGTGPASSIVLFPTVMNNLLGTKFKIVNGYNSSAEVYLAMEKGEVDSRSGSLSDLMTEHPDWIRDNKVVFLIQVGAIPDENLPDVPLITDLARDEEERQVLNLVSSAVSLGQPYLAPPGVPRERVALLRRALSETMRDATFLEEAKRNGLEIRPISGEEIQRIVHETTSAPPNVVARAKAAVASAE
jgi:tripartite-type tricarboxylate transporter receptor subunit TctC